MKRKHNVKWRLSRICIRLANRFLQMNLLRYSCLQILKMMGIRYFIARFDTNHLCNLQCQTCYFGGENEIRIREMDIGTFKRIASNSFPHIRILQLGCYAEPLCSNNFAQFLAIARQY